MDLTRQTDIAITALVHAAQAKGRLVLIKTIAKSSGTSVAHAAQVTRRLTQLGWLASHRGRSGGLTLAEGAETLPLGMIVHTLQPPRRDRAPSYRAVDFILQEAEQSRLACLDRYTLDDLASGRAQNCRHERDENLPAGLDRTASSATKAQWPQKETHSSSRLAPASRMG